MSADSWSACPECRIREKDALVEYEEKINVYEQELSEAYGEVDAEIYKEMLDDRPESPARDEEDEEEQNLREDYEIGTLDDGSFFMTYSCECIQEDCEYGFRIRLDRPCGSKTMKFTHEGQEQEIKL